MWFWIVSSIAGSILGSATNSWFEKTALGKWFYKKVESGYNWAAKRYDLKVLTAEEESSHSWATLRSAQCISVLLFLKQRLTLHLIVSSPLLRVVAS
mgnify:CR=1 FL=1